MPTADEHPNLTCFLKQRDFTLGRIRREVRLFYPPGTHISKFLPTYEALLWRRSDYVLGVPDCTCGTRVEGAHADGLHLRAFLQRACDLEPRLGTIPAGDRPDSAPDELPAIEQFVPGCLATSPFRPEVRQSR